MTVIGTVVVLLGLIAQFMKPKFIIYVFTLTTVFAGTAAMMIGGKPILLAVFFLFFLVIYILRFESLYIHVVGLVFTVPALKVFLIYALWGVGMSIFLPRYFEHDVWVYNLDKTSFRLQLLQLSGSHIAQILYLIGSLAMFWIVAIFARYPRYMNAFASAIIWAGILNIVFALMDLLNFYLGFPDFLTFFKNANYAMVDQSMHGLRRVSGVFPEASMFSIFSSGVMTFSYFLYRKGIMYRQSLFVFLMTLILLIISTSSSAYAAVAFFILFMLFFEIQLVTKGRMSRAFVRFSVASIIGLALLVAAFPETIISIIESTLIDKLSSASGVERMEWNSQALQNTKDTYFMGVGLGGNRASSLFMVLLSNIGIVGLLLYVLLIYFAIRGAATSLDYKSQVISTSAKIAFLVMLIPAAVNATSAYMGAMFSVLMAMACYSSYFKAINMKTVSQ